MKSGVEIETVKSSNYKTSKTKRAGSNTRYIQIEKFAIAISRLEQCTTNFQKRLHFHVIQ